MDRKGFLEQITLFGGCTLIIPGLLLQSCMPKPRIWSGLSARDIGLLDEIGETIIPKTGALPGAKEMEIGKYIVEVVNNCLLPEDQDTFLNGLGVIDSLSIANNGKPFEGLSTDQRISLLNELQAAAVAFNESQVGKLEPEMHYFSLLKELVVTGYFTTKTIVAEGFNYSPVPGRYNGCIDFNPKNDKPYKG